MPPEPSVTSACEGPRSCTLRYSSALLPKSFERPGPKSVSPATYCSGVEVVVWWRWIVDMRAPFLGGYFAPEPLPQFTAALKRQPISMKPSSRRVAHPSAGMMVLRRLYFFNFQLLTVNLVVGYFSSPFSDF